jgi:hypothetical protein
VQNATYARSRGLEDTHTEETDASLERDFVVVVGDKKIISDDTKNKPFGNFWKDSHLDIYIHITQCTQDAEQRVSDCISHYSTWTEQNFEMIVIGGKNLLFITYS